MPVMPQQWRKRYQWLPLLIIFITVLSLTGGTISLLYVESYLVGMAGETLALAATEIADKLNQYLYERYADAQTFSRAPIFQGTNNAAMTQYLMEVKQVNGYLWMGVTDASGRIVAASESSSMGQDRSASAAPASEAGTSHIPWTGAPCMDPVPSMPISKRFGIVA